MSRSKAFETALALINAEVTAEKLADKLKPVVIENQVIVEKLVEPRKPPTEFIDMTNEAVSDKKQILDEDGEGTVEKVLLRSPSSAFGIVLATDYETKLQGSYADFTDVFAYQEDSTYVLEITNINFTRNVRLSITTTQAVTFSKIFIKYQIKRPN